MMSLRKFLVAALLSLVSLPALAADQDSTYQTTSAQPEDTNGVIVDRTGSLVGATPRRRPSGPRDITLNYPNVDVHDVAKSILGDLLGLNYFVDQSVSGTVSVVTAEPVAKSEVLGVFESALKVSNLALIKQGRLYTIVTLAAAKKQPRLVSGSEGGYGTEAIQLRYVNPTDLKKLLEPLVPENAILQADPGRNALFITGTSAERTAIRDLIGQFDVNWMRGMSFAFFVPKYSDSRSLAAELDAMLNAPGSPAAQVVRLLNIERLNAVLAITSEPRYLRDIKKWVGVLDRMGGENGKRLFVYRVQNGRASDLAKSLGIAFGASNAQNPPTAPGTQAAQRRAPGTVTPTLPASMVPQSYGNNANGDDNNSDITQPGGEANVVSAQTLSIAGSESPVTISSDETNNAILVYATARQYAVIQDALGKLDILPLQVLLEASIVEVTLNDDLRYGVQWFFQSGSSTFDLTNGKTKIPVPTLPGFSYVFAQNNINATLSALQGVTTIKVVSAPKLLVLNNHTASMQVGDQVPVATQSSVSTDNPDAPIVNSIEYRDTGVILKVTPRVNDSGLVLLDIAQEVSDVSTTATSTIDSPTIQQRRIASSVAVRDGNTIALGGLIRDTSTVGSSGVPFLSQIPILGALFGDKQDDKKRTELLVLLTPRVLRNTEDANNATSELIEKLQATKPLVPPRK
jgi:general secretion pathway protein D